MATAGDIQMIEPDDPYAELMSTLIETIDEELRVVFQYDGDGVNISFLRDDLLSEDMVPRVDDLYSRSKLIETSLVADTESIYGELEANISVYEDTFVLQFVGQNGKGLVAVADRNGRGLVRQFF